MTITRKLRNANAGKHVRSPDSATRCCRFGAALALTADLVAQLPGSQAVLPLNAVTSLIGASVNPTTGAYSRGASGFWVENGEITRPVNEVTIAGSLPEMMRAIRPANDADGPCRSFATG